MNINKYTEKAQEAIVGAQQLADREGHAEILPEHLLVTLIEQRDGIVPSILQKMGADPDGGRHRRARRDRPAAAGARRLAGHAVAAAARQVTDAAEQEAERLKDDYVSTEHLFVAIAAEGRRSTGVAHPRAARDHARRDPPGADDGARLAARHQPEPRSRPTRRSSATAAISPSSRARASSIR